MMIASRTKWIIRFVCCCFIVSSSFARQTEAEGVRRLYVEPFTTKAGSEELRKDVIAQLRKLSSIALVSGESSADFILGGGGEIWIKGYYTLNPRGGRLSSDRTPLYAGFLSVELRDKNGVALWSYLVTPRARAENVSKDLSKRIARQLAKSLEHQSEAPFRTVPLSQPTTILKGAGDTFPYPVYKKWFTNYRRGNPNVEITYEPTGSDDGVRRLLAEDVDFSASANPEAIRQLASSEGGKYLRFPTVVGAVVPIVNLPGFAGKIAFTPEALSGIYLGKITKWNDPVLRRANRGLRLPDLDIVVVHRSDGSGASYAWTDYLSKTSPEWKDRVGSGSAPTWPIGRAANGDDGVAKLVKELRGSIGYVEFIYALRSHLSMGKVRNRNGQLVEASLESMAVAAIQSVEMSDDLRVSIVDPPGEGAYPIASFTWLVVPAHIPEDAKRNALTGFLKWMLGPGQTQAAALGYLPLPKDVLRRAQAAIARIN